MDEFIKIKLPRVFGQMEAPWNTQILGNSGTIGDYGCLETDATMVADYFGQNFDPGSLNDYLKKNGGYSGNLLIWAAFASLFGLKYAGQVQTPNALTADQMNQIRSTIDKGYPVFLQIDTIPATSKLDEHWILAIGYDGDDFIVQDPWDKATKRITSWGVQPQKLIYAYCWFEGKVPAQPSTGDTITIPVSERDQLVGRSTVAKEVAEYLDIASPDTAPTEAYTKVIAGIKGTVTATQTQLTQAKKDLAIAQQQNENLTEQVGRLKDQVLQTETYYKAQIDSLTKAGTAAKEIVDQANARVKALQGQVDEASKAKGAALKDLAEAKADLKACQSGQKTAVTLIERIINFFKNLGGRN